MNKFFNYIFALTAIAALGFMSSCSDDDETPGLNGPSISLSTVDGEHESDFTGYVGDSVGWTITVNAPAGFNTLNIYRQEDGVKGSPIKTFSKVSGTTPTSFEEDYGYTIGSDDIGNTVYIVFEAVDEEGRIATLDYQVKAEEKPTIKYEMTLLYAPNDNKASKTFFSTNDGQTYSMNDVLGTEEAVSAKIDFGYFYGTTFKATLASPDQYPLDDYGQAGWNVRNATKIKKTDLSAAAFIEIENDVEAINQAFDDAEFGTNEGQARDLTVGEVLAFELVSAKGNKRGLIKVNGIEGTTGTDAHIKLDVVVVD